MFCGKFFPILFRILQCSLQYRAVEVLFGIHNSPWKNNAMGPLVGIKHIANNFSPNPCPPTHSNPHLLPFELLPPLSPLGPLHMEFSMYISFFHICKNTSWIELVGLQVMKLLPSHSKPPWEENDKYYEACNIIWITAQ